ncbi:MAG: hypothetical protein NVV74_05270 [Magnetospirillum sp.]|nr:hypothetical protein [Magnetospirillum sp.]
MAVLREQAVDGRLELAEVERVLMLIGRGTMSLDDAYRVQEERCRKEHSRPRGNVGARSNPFQRLMVRPFESLLAGENPVYPRPFLGNYFAFVNHAMAQERDVVERDCRAIIQALLVVHGNNLTWDHFYSDPRTLRLLHKALRLVTHTLSTADGLQVWHQLMSLPMGDQPAPPQAATNQVRQALLETHRGLSAA